MMMMIEREKVYVRACMYVHLVNVALFELNFNLLPISCSASTRKYLLQLCLMFFLLCIDFTCFCFNNVLLPLHVYCIHLLDTLLLFTLGIA